MTTTQGYFRTVLPYLGKAPFGKSAATSSLFHTRGLDDWMESLTEQPHLDFSLTISASHFVVLVKTEPIRRQMEQAAGPS